MMDRRNFIHTAGTAGAITVAGALMNTELNRTAAWGQTQSSAVGLKKRIAIITTLWEYLAHGQHMGDRFLVGYPMDGRWQPPRTQVVSAFVAQRRENDLSGQRSQDHGFKVYPTITEALRCGGKQLAVDGVVVIGEHGDYPSNEKGQTLYPRFEFFQEVVKVFEADGRAVPMFNDKHLSYSSKLAAQMVSDSKRLGFPFLAAHRYPSLIAILR
jgi:hypothetical protein